MSGTVAYNKLAMIETVFDLYILKETRNTRIIVNVDIKIGVNRMVVKRQSK